MSDGDRMEHVTLRIDGDLLAEIDDQADAAGTNRSDVIRKKLHFAEAVEVQGQRPADIEGEIDEQIERNQTLRKVMPSKWRSQVRDLFANDIRADMAAQELEITAEAYRRQAEKLEELADTIPLAPDADLVGIVSDELMKALDAADLSNYYDGVTNPYEKKLSGVESGIEERKRIIPIIEQTMRTSVMLAEGAKRADYYKPRADELPKQLEKSLPENVDREDIAQVARELLQDGYGPDEVEHGLSPDHPILNGGDTKDEIRVPADETPPDRYDDATVKRQLQMPLEELEELDDDQGDDDDLEQQLREMNDDAKSDPSPIVESKQTNLVSELPAADGGRDPDSVPGSERGCEPMNDDTNPADSGIDNEPNPGVPADGESDE